MNDPIIQIMLNKKNKFNHIYLLKTDVLNNVILDYIKNQSVNDADYYFNLIRIYYYNYLITKRKYDNIEIKYKRVNKKEKFNKSSEIIKKHIAGNINKNTPSIKKENIYDEKYYTNYINFINNNKIEYKSKLMNKLFRFIVKKTHRDKTDNLVLNNIFLHTIRNYEENNISILFLIAYSLNYKIEELLDEDKYLLNKNITKIILITKQLIIVGVWQVMQHSHCHVEVIPNVRFVIR